MTVSNALGHRRKSKRQLITLGVVLLGGVTARA